MGWFARPEAALIVEAVGALVLIITLSFLARQVMLQRRDLEFRIYQQINDRYSDLLWRAVIDPDLDDVWRPLDANESAWLTTHAVRVADEGDDRGHWPVWTVLSLAPDELVSPPPFDLKVQRKLYRFTRAALELCEEAHFAQEKQSIQPETWQKFSEVLERWAESRYFPEVFTECESRLTPQFAAAVREIAPTLPPSD